MTRHPDPFSFRHIPHQSRSKQKAQQQAAEEKRAHWNAGKRGDPSFVCPVCGARSFHPEDVREGYCGLCHAFTGEPSP